MRNRKIGYNHANHGTVMDKNNNLKFILMLLILGLSLSGCASGLLDSVSSRNAVQSDEPALPSDALPAVTPSPSAVAQPAWMLPENLKTITVENARSIGQLAVVEAVFPKYFQISPDGRIGAQADLSGIDVMDMSSGELVMHISAILPDCEFGADRYFVFNQNGGFLALASRDLVQVWQVGGGLIYEAPYNLQYRTDPATCGADIPQLALSPDGTLLAVSGVEYTQSSAQQYFRIIDVLKNQAVYEWNGKDEDLHGKLYPYQGLGFSDDGKMIQTFDPTRYYALSGTEHASFRFWSVDGWQEIDRASEALNESFSPAQLRYALQGDDKIVIKNRLDGQVTASLSGTGCSQADPCDLRFSQQGQYAVILNNSDESITFHQDILASRLSIWNLGEQQMVDQALILARNLDGIRATDDGDYQDASSFMEASTPLNTWWTSTSNFNGLLEVADWIIAFAPQRLSMDAADCYFCGSCQLETASLQATCQAGILAQRQAALDFGLEAGRIVLRPQNSDEITIDLPAEFGENWDVRLLGYTQENQTVFYCLDKEQRSQSCHIYAAEVGKAVADPADIYGLRFSTDDTTAAYIDRDQKALFIVNLARGKATRVSAYQSRAWFTNPVFLSGESELVYLIQSLNDTSILSLEWVDASNAKVLRRVALDKDVIGQPTVLALNEENNLLAMGDRDGWIFLLDEEKGKIIASWQAHKDGLLGLTFAQDGQLLVSLDSGGEIKLWGVK